MPTPLTPANLIRDFGAASSLAAQLTHRLAVQLPHASIPNHYYALIIQRLVAHMLAPYEPVSPTELASNAWYQAHGITNFIAPDTPLYLHSIDGNAWAALEATISRYTFADAPPDALKSLYHHLFAPQQRHQQGEFYTPDWLAEYVLDQLHYTGHGRLLDPACGSGTFLVLALRRLLRVHPPAEAITYLAGYDIQPLAILTAKANLILALGKQPQPITLPVEQVDTLMPPPYTGELFDVIAGNPPWLNIEVLTPEVRRRYVPQWVKYDLYPYKGLASILGTGKKDLAMLMTYTVIDTYLRTGGTLGFILTRSALNSGAAGAGFRRFRIGEQPLQVVSVDDLGALKPFPDVSAPTTILLLKKGQPTHYPVPYIVWQKKGRSRLAVHDPLARILHKTERLVYAAEPAQPDDTTSAWLSAAPDALHALQKLRGASPYQARTGAYTGGANSVYWLNILEVLPDGLLRVANIIAGAKRAAPQVSAIIEDDLVYPLLRGRDVERWQAHPQAAILMVQDPQKRRGYDVDWLQAHYPRTYAYLAQFEPLLRERATLRRYFREDAPFYSMFDVGHYTFAPIKVVWQGMGARRMRAAVVLPHGGKPAITNQAMHPFIPFAASAEDEAYAIAALLNAAPFEFAVLSQTQAGGKSFAQPGILKALRLPDLKPDPALLRALAQQSRLAHAATQTNARDELHQTERTLNHLAAQAWDLMPTEIVAVERELALLLP